MCWVGGTQKKKGGASKKSKSSRRLEGKGEVEKKGRDMRSLRIKKGRKKDYRKQELRRGKKNGRLLGYQIVATIRVVGNVTRQNERREGNGELVS